jgi:hypothetical protein
MSNRSSSEVRDSLVRSLANGSFEVVTYPRIKVSDLEYFQKDDFCEDFIKELRRALRKRKRDDLLEVLQRDVKKILQEELEDKHQEATNEDDDEAAEVFAREIARREKMASEIEAFKEIMDTIHTPEDYVNFTTATPQNVVGSIEGVGLTVIDWFEGLKTKHHSFRAKQDSNMYGFPHRNLVDQHHITRLAPVVDKLVHIHKEVLLKHFLTNGCTSSGTEWWKSFHDAEIFSKSFMEAFETKTLKCVDAPCFIQADRLFFTVLSWKASINAPELHDLFDQAASAAFNVMKQDERTIKALVCDILDRYQHHLKTINFAISSKFPTLQSWTPVQIIEEVFIRALPVAQPLLTTQCLKTEWVREMQQTEWASEQMKTLVCTCFPNIKPDKRTRSGWNWVES